MAAASKAEAAAAAACANVTKVETAAGDPWRQTGAFYRPERPYGAMFEQVGLARQWSNLHAPLYICCRDSRIECTGWCIAEVFYRRALQDNRGKRSVVLELANPAGLGQGSY